MATSPSTSGVTGMLARLARPSFVLLGRRWQSFHVCGVIGAALGTTLGVVLAGERGLSPAVAAVMSGGAVAAAVAFHGLSWWLLASRRLIYYRYLIAVLAALSGGLWLLGQPVVPYLDVAILGLGGFLVAGRQGCFLTGCCRGVPHPRGVAYTERQLRAAFPYHLVHVRLVPTQVIESLGVLAMVIAASILYVRGAEPGAVLAGWIAVYGIGRFHLEWLRGDTARRFIAGFSEAQWTSLVVMAIAIAAGAAGVVPLRAWHVGLAAVVAGELAAVAVHRAVRGTGEHLLSHPVHLEQLALLVSELGGGGRREAAGQTRIGMTALGIQLSMPGERDGASARWLTLSSSRAPLSQRSARTLARWLSRLQGRSDMPVLHVRDSGVVHLELAPSDAVAAPEPPDLAASLGGDAAQVPAVAAAPRTGFHIRQIAIFAESTGAADRDR